MRAAFLARRVDLAFDVKFFGTARAIIFAQDSDEQAFRLGFSSRLPRASRLEVDHLAANVAINRIFDHQNLLFTKESFLRATELRVTRLKIKLINKSN